MTTAADYVMKFYNYNAHQGLPLSMTWSGMQRPTSADGAGIASYGYSQVGSGYNDNGVNFQEVPLVYSDRVYGSDPFLPGPQRFRVDKPDIIDVSIIVDQNDAVLEVHNETWGVYPSSPGGQLLGTDHLMFTTPGAGPNAPPAIVLVSLTCAVDHG